MERILYFDCFSGISGDMTLGALIDLGIDPAYVKDELKKLNISGYDIEIKTTEQNAIHGTDVSVHLTLDETLSTHHEHDHTHGDNDSHIHNHTHDHPHPSEHACVHEQNHEHSHEQIHSHANARNLYDIIQIIDRSSIKAKAKEQAIAIFTEIAKAEATVHGKSLKEVHFHEVGAIDSIADIVGTAICMEYLKIDRVCCSVIQDGHGFIECQHGLLPVPVPAVSQMLVGSILSLVSGDTQGELVTPTGFGILKASASSCGKMPNMKVEQVGYGFGKKNTGKLNALRVFLGSASEDCLDSTSFSEGKKDTDSVIVIETSLDDETGECLSYTMNLLFKSGALDVYHTPIIMKKNRPGILLTALCLEEDLNKMAGILFRETSAIGLRYRRTERLLLPRSTEKIDTDLGSVRVKEAAMDDLKKYKLEFDDCAAIAKKHNLPLREVYRQLDLFLSKRR